MDAYQGCTLGHPGRHQCQMLDPVQSAEEGMGAKRPVRKGGRQIGNGNIVQYRFRSQAMLCQIRDGQ